MQAEFKSANYNDRDGNPDGGYVEGTGFQISWQAGPLAVEEERREPNGAFVETVIAAAASRLRYYQSSKFACDENEKALMYLGLALNELNARTQRRISAGIEGTHEGS